MIFDKKFLINTLLIFFIIYDISFIRFPGLTSGRIAFFIILLKFLVHYNRIKFDKKTIYFLLFLLLLFLFSIIQYLNSLDFTQSSRILWFSIYSVLTPFLMKNYFSGLKDFLFSFLLATSVQSLITINSFISPGFKQNILNYIVIGGNDIENSVYRAIGFTSTSGAALSVVQFCGVFCGLILLKYSNLTFFKSTLVWVSVLVCLLSTFIIGRTGLICSLVSIFIFFLSTISFKKIMFFLITIIFINQINFIDILENQTQNIAGFKIDFYLNWIEDGLTIGDNNTVKAIQDMPIPPLSIRTILGTGEVFNPNTMKNASGNDCGYIQTYYSLGLVLAFLFYVGYFVFLFTKSKYNNLFIFNYLIVLMFIIEMKEPFIFKYVFPFFVLSLMLISNKKVKETKQFCV